MKTISGIEVHCAFDKVVDVEDEQLYAGVNGGRQVKAGEVLAVPPKCAVNHLSIHCDSPSTKANPQVLPVTWSIFTLESPSPCKEYRCGLVRLWRRIAASINSAPSLNCVLVIATQ